MSASTWCHTRPSCGNKNSASPTSTLSPARGTTRNRRNDEFAAFFEGLHTPDSQQFLDGSARIALKVEPCFNKYIFIEKDPKRFAELNKLKDEFPALASDIVLINAEANSYLQDICENRRWDKNRAVLFLDPFGMQVTWETITAIAKTKAIDLWLLFPLGIGVNRLLTRSGRIPDSWCNRLNLMFGATDWFDAFYSKAEYIDLFTGEPQVETQKHANFDAIRAYFLKRLKTIFPNVAKNPLPLFNTANCPLYLLCFAAGNPGRGGKTAVKIAEDILKL